MTDEQPTHDGDGPVDGEEVLRRGALIYAGKTIAATNGTAPGPEAPAALVAARKALRVGNDMPGEAADALRMLQMAAALFALDLADGHVDPDGLQSLEDALMGALERRSAASIVHARDDSEATSALSDRALDYAYQIIVAQESDAPVGGDAIQHATRAFHLATAAFTVALTISEGLDPRIPRLIEETLVAMFDEDEKAS
jgi:hypothetical protein